MQINTKYFGEIKVEEKDIISFPNGIPGFNEEKEYILIPLEDSPVFKILQSTNHIDPAFIVANPYNFIKDFAFDLDDSTVELLEIKSEKDVQVFSIVSLKDPFENSTANLQAPVVINGKRNIAKQYITNSKDYSTKEFMFTKKLSFQAKED